MISQASHAIVSFISRKIGKIRPIKTPCMRLSSTLTTK